MNQLAQNPSQPCLYHPTMNYMREQMFEKPLTPSDVGKLNRLVIPKQHAEKYFPLDSESFEKGLLLSFEDELGKLWKFRYSYWTSSQSYVLTKGWSRFVKEKRLDAGDVIVFYQCDHRLFISCRRRSSNDAAANRADDVMRFNGDLPLSPTFYATPTSPYPTPYYYMNSGEQVGSSTGSAALAATGNSRRLRLFGVNLECGPDQSEPQHFGSGSGSNQFLSTNASTSQL